MTPNFLSYLLEQGWLSPDQVGAHRATAGAPQSWIGQLMLNHSLIGVEEINEVLRRQDIHRGFFGENAIALGYITQSQLDTLLVAQELRRNSELIEELALAGCLDLRDGVAALCKFYSRQIAARAPARAR